MKLHCRDVCFCLSVRPSVHLSVCSMDAKVLKFESDSEEVRDYLLSVRGATSYMNVHTSMD